MMTYRSSRLPARRCAYVVLIALRVSSRRRWCLKVYASVKEASIENSADLRCKMMMYALSFRYLEGCLFEYPKQKKSLQRAMAYRQTLLTTTAIQLKQIHATVVPLPSSVLTLGS